jgi:hypothetical protein
LLRRSSALPIEPKLNTPQKLFAAPNEPGLSGRHGDVRHCRYLGQVMTYQVVQHHRFR